METWSRLSFLLALSDFLLSTINRKGGRDMSGVLLIVHFGWVEG